MKQFENAMTPEEKSKLFKAIDYQENSAPAEYPEEFVATTCTFVLRVLEIKIDDENISVVMSKLMGVKCRLDMRPATKAIKYVIYFGLETN